MIQIVTGRLVELGQRKETYKGPRNRNCIVE